MRLFKRMLNFIFYESMCSTLYHQHHVKTLKWQNSVLFEHVWEIELKEKGKI